MLLRLVAAVLGASVALTGAALADSAAPVIAQLRLPQRGASVDALVRVAADGAVSVERATLVSLTLAAPQDLHGDWIPLSAIDGLTVTPDSANAAYVLTCTDACFAPQNLSLRGREEEDGLSTDAGVYLNYDAEATWIDGEQSIAALTELNAFGGWGLVQTSWTVASDNENAGLVRLESRWTIDDRARRLRLRLGDSVATDATGAPLRFGGVQLGNAFELTPDVITFPTPVLAGAAGSPSNVDLYIDGVLRARESVTAGPFEINDAPVVNGAGQAQLVVTDVLGRQQIISQAFLVSTTLLRPGLSDWRLSAGAIRNAYGRESMSYGDSLVTGEYRRGLTRALTVEIAADSSSDNSNVRLGADVALNAIGQLRLARVQGESGGRDEVSWAYDAHAWSLSAQWQRQDSGFRDLTDTIQASRQSAAANLSVDFGDAGVAALTVATQESGADARASTASFDYSPDIQFGALSFRILYTEQERTDLSFGVSFTAQLRGGVSGSARYDSANGGVYRAALSRGPEPQGGVGWRASTVAGAQSATALALLIRGRLGEMSAEMQTVNDRTGVRVSQAGSVGWMAGHAFAGPRIDGAFALVDAGAPDVAIFRNGLQIGRSGADSRALAVNLQPYADNTIAIAADDLPIDRAPSSVTTSVTPPEGAGAMVRFDEAAQSTFETHVAYDTGAAPPRGAVLVRPRDGARFPIGSDGRVVLSDPHADDIVQLDIDTRCEAAADLASVRSSLTLHCAAAA